MKQGAYNQVNYSFRQNIVKRQGNLLGGTGEMEKQYFDLEL